MILKTATGRELLATGQARRETLIHDTDEGVYYVVITNFTQWRTDHYPVDVGDPELTDDD